MRNNSDRIRPNEPSEPVDAFAQQSQQNSVFSFATPTEMVELPSKGLYYKEGHPLQGKESVEIRFMTAKDEDILTSKSLLKQGIAIDRLIENVILDKRIKAKDLLPGDRNAVLVASRISGFGSDYSTNITCPACATTSKFTFDLENVKPKEKPDYQELDITLTDSGTFLTTLPRTKVEVEIKILDAKEESNLLASIDKQEKSGLPASSNTSYLSAIICSINGEANRITINRFIDNMPSLDSRHIRSVHSAVTPNIDMKHHFGCPKCGHEQEVDIPITVDFFWSK